MQIITSMAAKPLFQAMQDDKKINALLVQDLNYAKNLTSNDEKVRRNSLKYLKKYLKQRAEAKTLSEENLTVLWKGLFFLMWMSDKPLVQEQCAEDISNLLGSLPFEQAMGFFKVGLSTLQNEWFGIDQHRIDKFMMLLRRFLRQALFILKKVNFKKRHNEVFAKILEETVLGESKTAPLGLFMHFTEIYLEELAKVSQNKLQPLRTIDLLKPFVKKLAFSEENRIADWIGKFIFTHLLKQHKLGLEYEEKYAVWRNHGFLGSINQIQKVIVPDEGSEEQVEVRERVLDPRAGRVDVEVPQINFDAREVAQALLAVKSDPKTSKYTRNLLSQWATKFERLDKGHYPLGLKKFNYNVVENSQKGSLDVTKAAKKLIKFERQLLTKDDRGRKRKRGNHENTERKIAKKMRLTKTTKNESSVKRTKKSETSTPPWATSEFGYCFERNSGLWFVTQEIAEEKKQPGPLDLKPEKNAVSKTCASPKQCVEKLSKLKGKSRRSVDATPKPGDVIHLSKKHTPTSMSPKKVVINTKLNVSQDIDDHIMQVIASPQIPFDSAKKPGKPLLKTPAKSSPINPFYRLKTL